VTEDKSSRYHRLRRRADLAGTVAAGLLLAGLVASGADVGLREAAESWAPRVPVVGDLVAVALQAVFVSLLLQAVEVPFAWYQGFVLEHRYGLSTQTASRWMGDQAKGTAIGLALFVPGAAVVFGSLRLWPDYWWAASFMTFAIVFVMMVRLAPVLLMPMFYVFKPLDRPSLVGRLRALAERARTEIAGVYEWQLSSHTRKANAALAGLGRTRRILLSDTLLVDYSDDEIEVVLAHELAHHVHRDLWRGLGAQLLLLAGGFVLADWMLRHAAGALGWRGIADPAALPALLLTAGAWSLVTLPLMNGLSRAQERAADRYALTMTGNAPAFVSAMRRLAQQNLAEEEPSTLVRVLLCSHPPMRERIDTARAFEAPPPAA